MSEEITKKRGRQAMTEEEKAQKAAEREAAKAKAAEEAAQAIKQYAADRTKEQLASELLELRQKLSPGMTIQIDLEDIEEVELASQRGRGTGKYLRIGLTDGSSIQFPLENLDEENKEQMEAVWAITGGFTNLYGLLLQPEEHAALKLKFL